MSFMGFLCQEMSFVYDDYSHHVGQGKNYQGFHASVKYSVCSATCMLATRGHYGG